MDTKPVLFLDAEKQTYACYVRFIRLQFVGALANDAARLTGMSAGAGHSLMCRIRKRAYAWAISRKRERNGEISDVLIIRLMCERERAEADLKQQRGAKVVEQKD